MFIRKTELLANLSAVQNSLEQILKQTSWGTKNQIGLKHRADATDLWHDAAGSLYDRTSNQHIAHEKDFCIWNEHVPQQLREQIEILEQHENIKCGRVRFMRLQPKTGLSVHKDIETRYHLVLETNKKSYISINTNSIDENVKPVGIFYHIPKNSYWYHVDTTKTHWVYNGGESDRIHLVVCSI